MMANIAYRMALPFALFLGVGEIIVNWGHWGFWAFWVVDYVAVALLLWGWNATRLHRPGGMSRLTGAWGFTPRWTPQNRPFVDGSKPAISEPVASETQ
jgi:hypothetical protein